MATMNINHFQEHITSEQQAQVHLPQTSQGRALRTIEWFLAGRPANRDYDRANIRTLVTGAQC